jgi:hypothetical protein
MRWAELVARMGRGEDYEGFSWVNLRKRNRWGDRGVEGKIILRSIFRKWDVGVWPGLRCLSIETGGGHLKCGNELSGCIDCGEIFD